MLQNWVGHSLQLKIPQAQVVVGVVKVLEYSYVY